MLKQSKRSRKKWILVGVFIILLLGGCLVLAYIKRIPPFDRLQLNPATKPIEPEDSRENNVNYDKPDSEQQKEGERIKKKFIEKHEAKQSDNQEEAGSIAVTITNTSYVDGKLSIRAIVPTTQVDGTCTLQLTAKEGQSITREVGLQNMGSYVICKGFDEEIAKGDWHIRIDYKSNQVAGRAEKDLSL